MPNKQVWVNSLGKCAWYFNPEKVHNDVPSQGRGQWSDDFKCTLDFDSPNIPSKNLLKVSFNFSSKLPLRLLNQLSS